MPKAEPTTLPVGTPEDIAAAGESPMEWGSCYPQKQVHPTLGGPLHGCAYYESCIFKKPGPRNIGVYLEIAEGANKQYVTNCFTYMGALHLRAKNQENSGEVIAIIADEGDMIEEVVRVSEDPINCNKTGNMRLKEEVRQITVPPFPKPGTKESLIPPPDNDPRRFAKRMIELRKQSYIDKRLGIDGATVEVATASLDTEPTTAPVKRGPGRPPKRAIDPSEIGR